MGCEIRGAKVARPDLFLSVCYSTEQARQEANWGDEHHGKLYATISAWGAKHWEVNTPGGPGLLVLAGEAAEGWNTTFLL